MTGPKTAMRRKLYKQLHAAAAGLAVSLSQQIEQFPPIDTGDAHKHARAEWAQETTRQIKLRVRNHAVADNLRDLVRKIWDLN